MNEPNLFTSRSSIILFVCTCNFFHVYVRDYATQWNKWHGRIGEQIELTYIA